MELALTDGTLTVRPIGHDAAGAFAEAVEASAAQIRRWMGEAAAPGSPEAVAAYIDAWKRSRADGSGYGFLAEDAPGRCVGFGLVNQVNRRHRFANVGYWIRTDAAGRGYGTALTRLLARFGFDELGLMRLELVIEPENAASRRVAEKVGAVREGLLRNRLCIDGRTCDALMYGLIP